MSILSSIKSKLARENTRRARVLAELFADKIDGANVMDVGCLDGSVLHELKILKPGISCLGLDVVPNMKPGFPFVLYDGTRVPFKSKSIDIITCIFVLHHAMDPKILIGEFKRISKKYIVIIEDILSPPSGGMMIKFLHYLFDFIMILAGIVRRKKWKPGFPYNFKTDTEWRGIFKKYNLWPIYEKDFKLMPRTPITHILYVLDASREEKQ